MNTNQLKGKVEKIQGDAKIWLDQKTNNRKMEIEDNIHVANGKLIKQKEKAMEQYEKAKNTMEKRTEEVRNKAQLKWDKLKNDDIREFDKSFEKFASKLKEKYNHTQEEANSQIREFMNQF